MGSIFSHGRPLAWKSMSNVPGMCWPLCSLKESIMLLCVILSERNVDGSCEMKSEHLAELPERCN